MQVFLSGHHNKDSREESDGHNFNFVLYITEVSSVVSENTGISDLSEISEVCKTSKVWEISEVSEISQTGYVREKTVYKMKSYPKKKHFCHNVRNSHFDKTYIGKAYLVTVEMWNLL